MNEVEAVKAAIKLASCPGREGPFGGYDYGHNEAFYGPAPEDGRYVIRDFRDPKSPDWGKWLHQTDNREEHEAMFVKMTDDHIAQAAIAALDAVRGDAEPVAWRYVRKPDEWPPANPIVQSTRWLPDDRARQFWIEQPLYAHPPRGDQVARVVEWLRNGGGTDISQLNGSMQMLFLKGMNRYADAIERGEMFNG